MSGIKVEDKFITVSIAIVENYIVYTEYLLLTDRALKDQLVIIV